MAENRKQTTIGVISDTHGLLRPEAIDHLKGSDLIIHAGDIGNPIILETLRSIAQTFAVRGNVDYGRWVQKLPDKEVVEVSNKFIYVIHQLEALDLDPVGEFDAVIFGHSHEPERRQKEGVLYFNPGSAGPRRFKLPVTIGKITITLNGLESEIIHLIS
ncbi:MAG: metallophosphoesterase family protein [Desulfobacterales bacterium]|nr:metallophosphoesterase family protein [Desulfobacterales bacterium]